MKTSPESDCLYRPAGSLSRMRRRHSCSEKELTIQALSQTFPKTLACMAVQMTYLQGLSDLNLLKCYNQQTEQELDPLGLICSRQFMQSHLCQNRCLDSR